jgi:serine/threonine protein kinase
MVKIHACGIIHKDIKPSNILLKKKPDAEEFVVKITDFDLCVPPHPHTLNLQTRKLFAGTRSFMAPELIELPLPSHSRHQSAIFEANTTSLDIYSLGITFYYLFGGKSFAKKGKERDFEQEASSMRQYLEKDSIPFASFILCMVAHNPRDRPTAQEALDYFQASSLTKTVATINTQPV